MKSTIHTGLGNQPWPTTARCAQTPVKMCCMTRPCLRVCRLWHAQSNLAVALKYCVCPGTTVEVPGVLTPAHGQPTQRHQPRWHQLLRRVRRTTRADASDLSEVQYGQQHS